MLTPVVALVDANCLAEMQRLALDREQRAEMTPDLHALLNHNGWTVEAIVAGSLIRAGLSWVDLECVDDMSWCVTHGDIWVHGNTDCDDDSADDRECSPVPLYRGGAS